MANEITLSDIGDSRATNLLHRMVWDLNHDPTDLRQITERVQLTTDGAMGTKVPQLGRAYALAAPGEQTAPSNSAFVDASFTLTPARYALRFNPTDVAQISSPSGNILLERLVEVATGAIGQTFTDLHVALYPNLSNSVGGGAAVDFRMDDHFSALYQLHTSNARFFGDGGFKEVLKHHSYNELVNSLRSELGPIQFRQDVAGLMGAGQPGFRGRFGGVDIYSLDSVTESGGVTRNAMFGRYCFAFGEADVAKVLPYIDKGVRAVEGGKAYITIAYDDTVGDWDVICNYWPALAEAEDDEGVLISTDDT